MNGPPKSALFDRPVRGWAFRVYLNDGALADAAWSFVALRRIERVGLRPVQR